MNINEITYAINGAVFGWMVGLLINFKGSKADVKRFVLNLPEGHDNHCGDRSSPQERRLLCVSHEFIGFEEINSQGIRVACL